MLTIVTSVSSAIIGSNVISGDFSIPNTAKWINEGSKIMYNDMGSFTSNATTFTTDNQDVFVWGNTSSASTNITLAGALDRNVANTNIFTGLGIDPS